MLLNLQSRRFAAIAGEPADAVVPVTVAIRTAGYGMVTGELNAPADRWDPWLFMDFLKQQDEGPAS